jgi:hypothetical protein
MMVAQAEVSCQLQHQAEKQTNSEFQMQCTRLRQAMQRQQEMARV